MVIAIVSSIQAAAVRRPPLDAFTTARESVTESGDSYPAPAVPAPSNGILVLKATGAHAAVIAAEDSACSRLSWLGRGVKDRGYACLARAWRPSASVSATCR
jgi:hypothetical protein